MSKILISTPKQAHAHIRKIRTELDKIQADKVAHEQRKAMSPQLSLVDYMNSKGMPSKFSDRAALAQNYGFKHYHGTTEHNTRLMAILQNQHGNPNNNPA